MKGFDYSQPGAYFVTIVSHARQPRFGEIFGEKVRLNAAGQAVEAVWKALPHRYGGIALDAFVLMPNHLHGIVFLKVGAGPRACPSEGQPQGVAPTLSLPDVVQRFKSFSTARYRHGVLSEGWPPFSHRLWQRNYYEHVVRDEESLNRIREYISTNALRWKLDRENPYRRGEDPFDAWLSAFKDGPDKRAKRSTGQAKLLEFERANIPQKR